MYNPSRREFLKTSVITACSTGLGVCGLGEVFAPAPASSGILATPPPAPLPIKKGVLLDMLPAKLSYADRMKMAHDVRSEERRVGKERGAQREVADRRNRG